MRDVPILDPSRVPAILVDGPAIGRIAWIHEWDRQARVTVPEPDPWLHRRWTVGRTYQIGSSAFCVNPAQWDANAGAVEALVFERVHYGWLEIRPGHKELGEFFATMLARLGRVPWAKAMLPIEDGDEPIMPLPPPRGITVPDCGCRPRIHTFQGAIWTVCECTWMMREPVPIRRLAEVMLLIERHAPDTDLGYLQEALIRGDYTNIAPAPETLPEDDSVREAAQSGPEETATHE